MAVKIDLLEVFRCLSDAFALVGRSVGVDCGHLSHGVNVCHIATKIAEKIGLDDETCSDIYYTSLIHDCGVSTSKTFADLVQLDVVGEKEHCKKGSELMMKSPFTAKYAEIILNHHNTWSGKNPNGLSGKDIPIASRIIFLADRIDVDVAVLNDQQSVLYIKDVVIDKINDLSGRLFDPDLVEAFNDISQVESFWLDLVCKTSSDMLLAEDMYKPREYLKLDYSQLMGIADIFATVVDSKSTFTFQHSKRVSKTAVYLARKFSFSSKDIEMVKIAGLLHDLGKLSIPDYILDKAAPLDQKEFRIIQQHTYFTRLLLDRIKGFENISEMASLHHEKINGRGYPFRIGEADIPVGARILAVSDVFSALLEDRPYRKGFLPEKISEILKKQVSDGALDCNVVNVLIENMDELFVLIKGSQFS